MGGGFGGDTGGFGGVTGGFGGDTGGGFGDEAGGEEAGGFGEGFRGDEDVIDKLLLEAYHSGKILAGVSAGAICWFECGVTDSWESELKVLDCFFFIK